jgi:hypothetical protein
MKVTLSLSRLASVQSQNVEVKANIFPESVFPSIAWPEWSVGVGFLLTCLPLLPPLVVTLYFLIVTPGSFVKVIFFGSLNGKNCDRAFVFGARVWLE